MSHIAFLIPTVDRVGGAERQVALLVHGLLIRDWQVTVIALCGDGGEIASQLVSEGAGFLTLEMRKGLADPRGWMRYRRWIRSTKPDIVHAHLPHAAWLMRWSRLFAPVRVAIDTIHTSATGEASRKLLYRRSNWLTDLVTAVSPGVANAYLSARMVSADRLAVIPNGVETAASKPDAGVRAVLRRELGLASEFLWFAAGRLEPVKDYPVLLQAMAQLSGPAQLVVAGAGPLERGLRKMATHLGLDGRVRFLGFEANVQRWMQAADGFALSSRWEGLPMGLLEASACGLPAVATDVAGSREIVVHGHTGLLVMPGDATALAAAMTRLMQTPSEERGAMGDRARKLVKERYDIERILDGWEGLYGRLLEQNPRPLRWGAAH